MKYAHFKAIIIAVLIFTSFDAQAQVGLKSISRPITLEDIWKKGTFRAKSVQGINSLKDGKHYTSYITDAKEQSLLVKYRYADGKAVDTLLNISALTYNGKKLEVEDVEFNADETKALLKTETEPIYRRSSLENNYIYEFLTQKITPLSNNGKQKYAAFSPNSTKVAFVRGNNIFIKDLSANTETQITTDGLQNNLINGGTDWVYEEEFEFARAFFWNVDGSKLAYYKFDESKVKEYSFSVYDSLYPTEYRYKYPKAGEDNSVVSIYFYDLNAKKTTPADIGTEKNQYIPRIKWTKNANTLCIFRMNRVQNNLEYLFTNATTGSSEVKFTDKSETYVEVNDDMKFLEDGKQLIYSSEKDGYKHFYIRNFVNNTELQLTKGAWEVTELYGVDEKNKRIYYQSAEQSAMRRNVYVIDYDGKNKLCLTKSIGTNNANFSADYSYFINNYSAANKPPLYTLVANTGKEVRKLQDNIDLSAKCADYGFGNKEFIQIPAADGTTQLNAYLIKPKDFDPGKKYPVYMFLYGGPGSQQVLDQWGSSDFFWHQMLTQKGYIVACVDNRGTGARGVAFKKCTYLKLGDIETQDQIAAAKWLGNQSFVDASRIGIQGWSFGGYMSSLCITKGADVFKMAIAVAPVTNWRYYDNIYTERFLRTPQENPKGYDENSPINFVNGIKGKYLLVHGTADDNVHFQNATEMILSLNNKNIPYESAYYPNKNHGIYGGLTRLHLFTRLTDFTLKNL